MTRTTERLIWIGAVVALLAIGAIVAAGSDGWMFDMCRQTMQGGGMSHGGSAPPVSGGNSG